MRPSLKPLLRCANCQVCKGQKPRERMSSWLCCTSLKPSYSQLSIERSKYSSTTVQTGHPSRSHAERRESVSRECCSLIGSSCICSPPFYISILTSCEMIH